MKWVLNKWGGRDIRWCGMLKGENEGVENGESVETIVHFQHPHFPLLTFHIISSLSFTSFIQHSFHYTSTMVLFQEIQHPTLQI